MKKTSIAIMQGDIAGIGPELLIKLLSEEKIRQRANYVIIGAIEAYRRGEETVGKSIPIKEIHSPDEIDFSTGDIYHLNLDIPNIANVPFSQVSKEGGQSSVEALTVTMELFKAGIVGGGCFMPFNKECMHMGGNNFTDEIGFCTNYLEFKGLVNEFNVVDGIWNARVTSHIPLKDVPAAITFDRVLQSIRLANGSLKKAGFDNPRIAVSGLNPHSGDGGLLGMEEIESIIPAIKQAQEEGINVKGPFPGDTVYIQARDGVFDTVVTMYHDQGQIAIKMMGFDRSVTVLCGLPIPITTPAHGTAFDIAGQNKANVVPSYNALMMCADMADNN